MNGPPWYIPAIVAALWLAILLFLRAVRRNRLKEASLDEVADRAGRLEASILAGLSLLFLVATAAGGIIQDYFLYLQMWREIQLGHDPWFLVMGVFGSHPLNAYGPLFNALALPAWLHPLLPKLLFATSYACFAIWMIIERRACASQSGPGFLVTLIWFWNPYVWVELAHFGHFEILVGLLCVAALEARARRWDVASGTCLALGVLLKYSPIVLLPFLAVDHKSIRWRLAATACVLILLGFGGSYLYWGPSLLRPLEFAASRGAHHLSIYRFLTGIHTPFGDRGPGLWLESWAPYFLALAILRTWSWHWERHVDTGAAVVVASFVTVLLYQVGFAQYPMVPFVLASWWYFKSGPSVPRRLVVAVPLVAYFAWIATYDMIMFRIDIDTLRLQEWVGLPTFLLGCAVVAALVAVAPRDAPPGNERATA